MHQPLTAAMTGLVSSQRCIKRSGLSRVRQSSQHLRDVGALRQAVRPDCRSAATGNVVARGECATGARQDDVADLRIRLCLVQRDVQFVFKVTAEGVQGLGAVEGDEHALALLVIQDVFVAAHFLFLSFLLLFLLGMGVTPTLALPHQRGGTR